MKNVIKTALLLYAVTAQYQVAYSIAEPLKKIPNIVWEKTIGEDTLWYEPMSITLTKTNDILAAVKVSIPPWEKPSDILKPNQLWLWRIDEQGNKYKETRIEQLE